MSEEQLRKIWEKYTKIITSIAIKYGWIGAYSNNLIESMRITYYGGIPASILLLLPELCRGYCYDRATLMAAVLKEENFRRVDGNILGIRFNPNVMKTIAALKKEGKSISPNYANHCWIEVKWGGFWYVINASSGTIILRELFYLIQRPKITRICTKEEIKGDPDYIDILNADIERDKYAALFLLPLFETYVDNSPYKEQLKKEIAFYKDSIHYEELMEQDKKERSEREKLEERMRFKMTNKNTN